MTTIGTVAALGAIVLVAAALQRTVGFGFALLAVPLATFVVPTKSAVVIVFLNGAVTSAWVALRLRRQIDWPLTRLLGVGTVLGAPFGVVILSAVSATILRLGLGVVTCLAAVWIILTARLGRGSAEARPWRALTLGVASGVLNTSLATSGPPLVYELRRTGLEADRFRATISAAFVLANLVGLPLLALAGLITASDVALALFSLVPCVVGIAVGGWASARMDPSHFVWAVDLLLLVTGAVTVAKALG